MSQPASENGKTVRHPLEDDGEHEGVTRLDNEGV